MASDTFTPPVNVGSTDWSGRTAPSGGTHTGTATITMQDGVTFFVAHSVAEVMVKMDQHAIPQSNPTWVAFDVPGIATPIVLNVGNIQGVQ